MDQGDHCCHEGSVPDIPHLIRSIQRIKGNPDCFGMMVEACQPLSCCWYELCSKMSVRSLGEPMPEDRSGITK